VTQEFYISVTPVRDGDYLVRTERVAMGVPLAEELVPWDVDRWLTQTAQVRGKRSGSTATAPEAETYDLTSLGRELYDAIFQGTIRDSWMIAQGVAQNQNEVLRLRLGLKDDRLPLLPWEVMNDGARPLATNTDIVFSRYRSSTSRLPNSSDWQRDESAAPPLQILMVLAAPTDQEVLQLHQEAAQLQAELQRETPGSDGGPTIALTILDQPGREQLTQALEQSHYDVLHYAGHSNLSDAGGDLYLVSDKTGLTEVLSGDDLAGLLVNNGVRMVVFNSCQGFESATKSGSGASGSTSGGSLADALLKRNIPAVLAMAEQIPDDVALNLSRLFYRNLKQRAPIDLSLARARQGLLSSYGSDQLYWALPILYMHAEFEGYLQGRQPDPTDPLDVDWETNPGDWEPEDLPPRDWPGNTITTSDQDQKTVNQLLGELNDQAPAMDLDLPDRNTDAIDFHRLGQKLAAEGDLIGALEAYGNAINLNPEFAAAYNDLGLTFEQNGSQSEAMTSYKMALRYDPQLTDAATNLKRLTTEILQPEDPLNPEPIAPTPLLNQINPTRPTPAAGSDRMFASGTTTRPPTTGKRLNGKTIAMTAATFAVLGSIWFLAGKSQNHPPDPATPLSQETISNNRNNQELVAISTQSFNQQELRKGTEAVAQLLDNGALVEAESALNAVPSKNVSAPAISYLRGRLAWESIKRQPTAYSYTDARRNWGTAVKEQPNDLHYRTTLGFGFYAERNWDEAAKTWKQASQLSSGDATKDSDPERLTADAGQALALAKQSEQAGKPDAAKLQAAKQLRDRVLRANPSRFQPNNLTKDWRWTEQMIADWTNLLAQK
jgi:tetratricopeptide (TPR) repeat protein